MDLKNGVTSIQRTVNSDGRAPKWGLIFSEVVGPDYRIEVAVTTLDASLRDFDGPYSLKLDTHGAEKAILRGGISVV